MYEHVSFTYDHIKMTCTYGINIQSNRILHFWSAFYQPSEIWYIYSNDTVCHIILFHSSYKSQMFTSIILGYHNSHLKLSQYLLTLWSCQTVCKWNSHHNNSTTASLFVSKCCAPQICYHHHCLFKLSSIFWVMFGKSRIWSSAHLQAQTSMSPLNLDIWPSVVFEVTLSLALSSQLITHRCKRSWLTEKKIKNLFRNKG